MKLQRGARIRLSLVFDVHRVIHDTLTRYLSYAAKQVAFTGESRRVELDLQALTYVTLYRYLGDMIR
jgi:hypothetical protein